MSACDPVPDTPILSRYVCLGCEPEADPSREILEPRWCSIHAPTERGLDDSGVVQANAWISGSGECDGEDNRKWCQLLHRTRTT